MPKPTPSPRHRWLRFSLASLLVVTTVFCITLAVVFNRVRRQRDAVAAFEAAGGTISYRQPYRTSRAASDPLPGPPWLLAVVSEDFFREPKSVWLCNTSAGDKLLAEHLGGVWRAEHLSIVSPQVTDASMDEVAKLTELRTLYLTCPQITDVGLRKLTRLKKLTTLAIGSPQMTDEALTDLASLPQASTLRLDCPLLTPEGVRLLKGMGAITSVGSLRDSRNGPTVEVLSHSCLNVLVDVSTSEAIQLIADQYGLIIKIDSISQSSLDQPFTFEKSGHTVSQVLDELLAAIEADYFLESGTIKIVPKKNGQPYRAGYRAFGETFPNCKRILVDW